MTVYSSGVQCWQHTIRCNCRSICLHVWPGRFFFLSIADVFLGVFLLIKKGWCFPIITTMGRWPWKCSHLAAVGDTIRLGKGCNFQVMICQLMWLVVSNKCFMFTPKIGEDKPILTCAYFSKGLVQPPTMIRTHQALKSTRQVGKKQGSGWLRWRWQDLLVWEILAKATRNARSFSMIQGGNTLQ